jgi:hypothetical protein
VKWRLEKPTALPLNRWLGNPNKEYSWDDWKRDTKAKYPVRYFLQETLPLWFKVHFTMNIEHAWYWLRTHTVHRYHVLDLRNPEYKWGWRDRSQTMMYACFNLVKDFVEKEKAFDCHVSWDSDDEHREAKAEIMSIYTWWTKDRWELDKQATAATKNHQWGGDEESEASKQSTKEYRRITDEIEATDQKMLEKAIKFRGCMWT